MSGFYVTPSRISRALECGLKYRRQFIEKLPTTDKPSPVMFAGDMQHRALERWGADDADLIAAHAGEWEREVPDGFRDLFREALEVRPLVAAHDARLAELAEAIRQRRPDVKNPRRTKEWQEAANDDGGVGNRYARAIGRIDEWYRSDDCPWAVRGPNPWQHFLDGEAALEQFRVWWDGLDEKPDVVHTEAKRRISLADGAFELTGVIDAVWVWPDGAVEVLDYKRSAGREDDIAHFVQAASYALTCAHVIGIEPDRVAFHHLREGERLVYTVQPDWTDRLVELADRVRRMHADDDFVPSFRTCSWCDYRAMCHDQFNFHGAVEPARTEEAV